MLLPPNDSTPEDGNSDGKRCTHTRAANDTGDPTPVSFIEHTRLRHQQHWLLMYFSEAMNRIQINQLKVFDAFTAADTASKKSKELDKAARLVGADDDAKAAAKTARATARDLQRKFTVADKVEPFTKEALAKWVTLQPGCHLSGLQSWQHILHVERSFRKNGGYLVRSALGKYQRNFLLDNVDAEKNARAYILSSAQPKGSENMSVRSFADFINKDGPDGLVCTRHTAPRMLTHALGYSLVFLCQLKIIKAVFFTSRSSKGSRRLIVLRC